MKIDLQWEKKRRRKKRIEEADGGKGGRGNIWKGESKKKKVNTGELKRWLD